MERWRPGEVILMEAFTFHSGCIWQMPEIVVEDNDRYLAIVSLPGMTFLTRDEPGREQMPLEDRVAMYLEPELPRDWYERTMTNRAVLTLHPHGESHSVRLFFDAAWNFQHWYVNMERPYWRRPGGIRTKDHILDILVTPALEWTWKDADEFALLIEAGSSPTDEATAIRAEGEKVIARLEAREWPFNEPWPEWRPDPSWKAPKIADLLSASSCLRELLGVRRRRLADVALAEVGGCLRR